MRHTLTALALALAIVLSTAGSMLGSGPNPEVTQLDQSQRQMPAAPRADLGLTLVGELGGASYAVAVRDNLAYVGMGPNLMILDVADPARPQLKGKLSLPSVIEAIAVDGDYVYVAAGGMGLWIVDISDPAAPTRAGFCDTPGHAQDLAIGVLRGSFHGCGRR